MLFKTFVEETWRPSIGRLRECTRVGYESTLRCHILPKWAWSGRDGNSQRVFTLLPDGTFGYSNRGSAQNGDGFTTSMTYIVA